MGNFKHFLSMLGTETVGTIKNAKDKFVDDIIDEQRTIGTLKFAAAMIELKIKDDVIIEKLQKYYNLRRSEATDCIQCAKEHMEEIINE